MNSISWLIIQKIEQDAKDAVKEMVSLVVGISLAVCIVTVIAVAIGLG